MLTVLANRTYRHLFLAQGLSHAFVVDDLHPASRERDAIGPQNPVLGAQLCR